MDVIEKFFLLCVGIHYGWKTHDFPSVSHNVKSQKNDEKRQKNVENEGFSAILGHR